MFKVNNQTLMDYLVSTFTTILSAVFSDSLPFWYNTAVGGVNLNSSTAS